MLSNNYIIWNNYYILIYCHCYKSAYCFLIKNSVPWSFLWHSTNRCMETMYKKTRLVTSDTISLLQKTHKILDYLQNVRPNQNGHSSMIAWGVWVMAIFHRETAPHGHGAQLKAPLGGNRSSTSPLATPSNALLMISHSLGLCPRGRECIV